MLPPEMMGIAPRRAVPCMNLRRLNSYFADIPTLLVMPRVMRLDSLLELFFRKWVARILLLSQHVFHFGLLRIQRKTVGEPGFGIIKLQR